MLPIRNAHPVLRGGIMSIDSTNLSTVLYQLAERPALQPAASSDRPQQDSADSELPSLNKQSAVGSGLRLSLSLSSGQEIDLEVRINQAGGLSDMSLITDSPLSEADEDKLQQFLSELGKSVDQLFRSDEKIAGQSGLFDFSNLDGVGDIDLDLYQDDGRQKQILEFDKIGDDADKRIEAELYRYDRNKGTEDQHNFKLSKQARDDVRSYGSLSYGWLFDQVDQALSVIADQREQKLAGSFFKSGLRALFETANQGHQLLQDLGASARDSRDFLGKAIRANVSEKAINGLPDFNGEFSSQRHIRGQASSDENYELAMQIRQISHSAYDEESESNLSSQNRSLKMQYESAQRQAVYNYLWTRDESVREVHQKGQLQSSHYRLDEVISAQLTPTVANGTAQSTEQSEHNQLRQDQNFKP